MALRMERQAQNAARLADFLATHPLVKGVNYPGLASHPGAAMHAAQATHAGSLLSFETGRRGPRTSSSPLPSTTICQIRLSWHISARRLLGLDTRNALSHAR